MICDNDTRYTQKQCSISPIDDEYYSSAKYSEMDRCINDEYIDIDFSDTYTGIISEALYDIVADAVKVSWWILKHLTVRNVKNSASKSVNMIVKLYHKVLKHYS